MAPLFLVHSLVLVATTSREDHREAESWGWGGSAFYPQPWPHRGPRTLSQPHTAARGSMDANPNQCQSVWGAGGSLGTDPRPNHKVDDPDSACWLGVSQRFQETSGRWPSLTLTLSFPHRTEFEAPPRPASPKVSRSPPEAAAPVEDTARKSESAVGGRVGGGGQSRPSHVFRRPAEGRGLHLLASASPSVDNTCTCLVALFRESNAAAWLQLPCKGRPS